MKIAIYARYSTDKQDARSIDDQVRRCREFAKRQGWTVAREFSDAAQSGAHTDRASLQEIVALVKKRGGAPFKALLVDDLSRLSRDLWNMGQLVFRDLQPYGVDVWDVSTGMAASSPAGRMVFAALGMAADQFLESVRKQTHRGLEGRALAGFWPGGRCYGYATKPEESPADPEHPRAVPVIDQGEAETVRRIFREYVAGVGLASLADSLNRDGIPAPYDGKGYAKQAGKGWQGTSIRAVLTNERYTGRFTWNKRKWTRLPGAKAKRATMRPPSEWITREAPELAIVDRATWDAAQARLKERSRPTSRRTAKGETSHVFSGLLRCGVCGASMSVVSARVKNGKRYANYGCSAYTTRGASICANSLHVSEAKIEETVLGALGELLSGGTMREALTEALKTRLGELNRAKGDDPTETAIREAQRQVTNLAKAVALAGWSDALGQELKEAEAHLKTLKAGRPRAQVQKVALPPDEEIDRLLAGLASNLRAGGSRTREALRGMVGQLSMCPKGEGPDRHYEAIGAFNFEVLDRPSCGGRI